MAVSLATTDHVSIQKSKKRKHAGEESKSQKRSRTSEIGSRKIIASRKDRANVSSDVIVGLKSSRLSPLLSQKKSRLSLKYILPEKTKRIWVLTPLPNGELRYVLNLASTARSRIETEENHNVADPQLEVKESTSCSYRILGISELQSPYDFYRLGDDVDFQQLSSQYQLVPQKLLSQLIHEPIVRLHGEEITYADLQHGEKNISHTDGESMDLAISSHIDINAVSSLFQVQTVSLYLPLSPIAQLYPLAGLCAEHISPLLLTYYAPFKGVVLAYSNPRLSSRQPVSHGLVQGNQTLQSGENQDEGPVLANIPNEYATSFVWLTAEFILLRSSRECFVTGWINLLTESHIGLVCWNLFGASIAADLLPSDWKWKEATAKRSSARASVSNDEITQHVGNDAEINEGHYMDGAGRKVQGWLTFRIIDFDVSSTEQWGEKGFITLQGSLVD